MRKILKGNHVGLRIKLYLVEKGIKQGAVAKAIGLDEDKLSTSLSGKRKLSAEEFARIVKFLGVSADLFIQ